jgi:hypothetical protein
MAADTLAALDNLSMVGVEVDRQDAAIAWTGGFLELIKERPDDLRGRSLLEFASPHDRDGLRHVLTETAN